MAESKVIKRGALAMEYQLLVSTMNQNNFSLIQSMKIDSDAIIINQSQECMYEKIDDPRGYSVEMYSFAERGVGLSRNSAFMRSTAEIIEFADDDMIFVPDYREKVLQEFRMHPEADAILFSIESLNKERPFHKISKFKRIHKIESRKYGCARLAVRREKLLYNNISFSLLFGGGAKYGAGEDTIFINDLLRAGLKIYGSPTKVADVKQESSSWFSGYTDKYYFDKGALMCATYPYYICKCIAFFMAIRHAKANLHSFNRIFKLYIQGISDYRRKM